MNLCGILGMGVFNFLGIKIGLWFLGCPFFSAGVWGACEGNWMRMYVDVDMDTLLSFSHLSGFSARFFVVVLPSL